MTQKFPNGTIVKFKSGPHFGGLSDMNFHILHNDQWKAVKDQKLTVISYNTDMKSYQLNDASGNIIYPNVKEEYLTTPSWFGGKRKTRRVKKSKRKHTRKSKKTNKKRRSTRRR